MELITLVLPGSNQQGQTLSQNFVNELPALGAEQYLKICVMFGTPGIPNRPIFTMSLTGG